LEKDAGHMRGIATEGIGFNGKFAKKEPHPRPLSDAERGARGLKFFG
jgi:hypothetical protein